VILFSKKTKTPSIFKVLSAKFFDRVRFGFVSEENEEIIKQFEAKILP
jgi:hypothetical protein